MGSYLVRRFGLMLLTLFGISVIIFLMLRLAPGNIADILFDAAGFVDPAEKTQIMKDLGLDKPIPVQYAQWISGLLQGDLGYSYVSDRPAIREILPRIPIQSRGPFAHVELLAKANFLGHLMGEEIPIAVVPPPPGDLRQLLRDGLVVFNQPDFGPAELPPAPAQ